MSTSQATPNVISPDDFITWADWLYAKENNPLNVAVPPFVIIPDNPEDTKYVAFTWGMAVYIMWSLATDPDKASELFRVENNLRRYDAWEEWLTEDIENLDLPIVLYRNSRCMFLGDNSDEFTMVEPTKAGWMTANYMLRHGAEKDSIAEFLVGKMLGDMPRCLSNFGGYSHDGFVAGKFTESDDGEHFFFTDAPTYGYPSEDDWEWKGSFVDRWYEGDYPYIYELGRQEKRHALDSTAVDSHSRTNDDWPVKTDEDDDTLTVEDAFAWALAGLVPSDSDYDSHVRDLEADAEARIEEAEQDLANRDSDPTI